MGGYCLGPLPCLCVLVLAGVAGVLVWYFTKGNGGQSFDDDGSLGGFETFMSEQDPFQGALPNEVPRWPHEGYGLSLQIVNALDDVWMIYFDQAVSDWNSGDPDVLTLTTASTGYDPKCDPIDGVMKICNGDHGDAGWLGITEILAVQKEIVSSVAKMNDYYFTDDPADMADRRQYTMCHEMGHGFGLPHTDENFNNEDNGECMDYTNNPENNLHPNEINWSFLKALYSDSNGTTTTIAPTSVTDDVVGAQGSGRREMLQSLPALPEWVKEEWRQVSATAHARSDKVPEHWRMLRSHPHGDLHEVVLGEEYSIYVKRLRPVWLN